ncbi:hypothetical protein PYR66_06550 [Klebsiella aerogenes]|nr:hypothetical protein PYR66_06550 [Klebsiella aerogenes]
MSFNKMFFVKIIFLVFFFHAESVFAASIDCEPTDDPWSKIHVPFELMPSDIKITVGTSIPDYTALYTFKSVAVLNASANCTGGLYSDLGMLSSPTLITNKSGNNIFPTNVPGIGVSVSDPVHANFSYKAFPNIHGGTGRYASGNVMYVDVTFWKVPGIIPLASGPITVTGPEMAIFLDDFGYTLTSQYPERIVSIYSEGGGGNGKAYVSGSRILTASFIFQPGTCNVQGDNVNVDMGKYDGLNGHSDWKDASFHLVCPDGYGYGGTYDTKQLDPHSNYYNISPGGSYTANNQLNGRVQVKIIPLNSEVIDANRGIIALDGSGAQGYGIQLAWGDYSTQTTGDDPASPVILGTPVDANTLNSAFSKNSTPIGGNAFTGGDNTIKMAARYVRTTGDAMYGSANAIVQVIANYQ